MYFGLGAISRCPSNLLLFKEKSKRIFPPIGARAVVLRINISNKKKETAPKEETLRLGAFARLKKTVKPPTL
ncbi:hypothetical protein RC62_136 [Flavobacterium aquidurense]|uniref:Uncharacterized protein n=1 Tax=Flavobacterium aquidurense TaxID=362413 RepID=A0A0Q0S977_9FLAO|nr:hypothetical protein RC62_136 [Flavobacterium aquidurense]